MIPSTYKIFLRHIKGNNFRRLSITCTNFNKDDDIGDDKRKKAAKKLDLLLKSIIEEEGKEPKEAPQVQYAPPKPREKYRAKKASKIAEKKVEKTLGAKIVEAAKDVASTIEGDRTETEAQLLHKLLYKNSSLKDDITKAATSTSSLSELLSGMEIEKEKSEQKSIKTPPRSISTRAEQVRSALDGRPIVPSLSMRKEKTSIEVGRVNLFAAKPLGIFKEKLLKEDKDFSLETWQRCYEREIRLSVTHPPLNIYEQMIMWTERGMLWKFPIDNEQGMEDEKKVDFSDHVFLETHLEDWCPTAGPIRHFMELVCVGLSRNHWLTAQEKKDHIMWYKEFFSSKRALIKEIGAGEIKTAENLLQ